MKNPGPTNEALKGNVPDDSPDIGFTSDSAIVAVKGPAFVEDFMGSMSTVRGELAQMIVASMVNAGKVSVSELESKEDAKRLAFAAFNMADEFVLAQFTTLEPRMEEYWQMYMRRSKSTDEVLADFVDASKSYHLPT